ncbi:hypothetical protein QFZ79_000910 [Arthrobacter sp. V4I6]|uniref:hypothetical protein n=1 Tax=unclassified Arthrobacter TaxID=235627 RepID=UPI00278A2D71|nr:MULTISPECIES: hypothetical protein [unclassified Arthrobacter]MDQ0823168.1 hypothetical protein [Arthrobacter sp. V1I7]MDQ0852799.1 hypothetical protein [Arthrobacter sp. V4I6]
MRKFAWVLALAVAALPAAGCLPATACPAIGQAPVVSLTVARDYAGTVQTVRLRACQEGRCVESELELFPGSTTVDQGCEPGPDSGRACSATASPDGTLTGMLMLDRLTDSRIDATSTGSDVRGLPLPVRTVTFTPRAAYPYGQQCGRFISAGLVLDPAGLRQAD